MSAFIEHILGWLAGIVTAIIVALGLPGITLLMAIASACIPIPSEIVLPFAGYLVSLGKFSLVGVTVAAVVGENIGAAFAYELGKRGGLPLMERYGRYVLIDAHHIDQATRFFTRFGSAAVMIGRMLPLVRAFVALPAGVARMNRVKFHLFTTLGSIPWCFGLAWLGLTLGKRWNTDPTIKAVFHQFDIAIVVVVLAAAAWLVWSRVRGQRRG